MKEEYVEEISSSWGSKNCFRRNHQGTVQQHTWTTTVSTLQAKIELGNLAAAPELGYEFRTYDGDANDDDSGDDDGGGGDDGDNDNDDDGGGGDDGGGDDDRGGDDDGDDDNDDEIDDNDNDDDGGGGGDDGGDDDDNNDDDDGDNDNDNDNDDVDDNDNDNDDDDGGGGDGNGDDDDDDESIGTLNTWHPGISLYKKGCREKILDENFQLLEIATVHPIVYLAFRLVTQQPMFYRTCISVVT